MSFPSDYYERVYAGVLGKIIGVYLGRPIEGWTYERIMADLGEIEYYVIDRIDLPLIITRWSSQMTTSRARLPSFARYQIMTMPLKSHLLRLARHGSTISLKTGQSCGGVGWVTRPNIPHT